jgi:predicted secreted protein
MTDPDESQMNQIADSVQPSSANNYTEASNGQTIYIKLGDTIHVQLTSRLDQGLLWNVTVTNGLNVTGNEMYPPVQGDNTDLLTGVIAFNATQEWDIQAIATGTQEVTGVCRQSSNTSPVEDRYELTVIVSD